MSPLVMLLPARAGVGATAIGRFLSVCGMALHFTGVVVAPHGEEAALPVLASAGAAHAGQDEKSRERQFLLHRNSV
jgi:hypothetical protein